MGWKSTIDITREEAINLVIREMSKVHLMSDHELEDYLELLGFGNDSNLPYHGYNFNIIE